MLLLQLGKAFFQREFSSFELERVLAELAFEQLLGLL
jgi:hypothetical protein